MLPCNQYRQHIWHACPRVWVGISACVCVNSVSVPVTVRLGSFVWLKRAVQGLRWGRGKIIFSCFAMKALLNVTEETHCNGGGLGWIIQHLQSILILTSSRHLHGPQGLQARHGNVDNSRHNAVSGPLATREAAGAWIFLCIVERGDGRLFFSGLERHLQASYTF